MTQSVLLGKSTEIDWPKIAEAVSRYKKIPFQDALFEVKRGRGVLAENISPSEAQAFVSALETAGLCCRVLPHDLLKPAELAHAVSCLNVDEAGLTIKLSESDQRVVPWNVVQLLVLSVFKESTSRSIKVETGPSSTEKFAKMGIMLATGIPLPMSKKKVEERKVVDTSLSTFLDLFLSSSLLRLRFDSHTIDYSFLGPRKQMSADLNFKILVNDIFSFAPNALKNKAAHVFVANQPLQPILCESQHDLDAECRWLLALANMPNS